MVEVNLKSLSYFYKHLYYNIIWLVKSSNKFEYYFTDV